MRKIYFQTFILTLAIFVNVNKVLAQKDTSKMNKEVEVVKPYRPNISTANKINQLPIIEDTTRFTPEFNYQINSKPASSKFKSGQFSIPEVKKENELNNGLGYLKAGAGTYNSTYGDLYLSNNQAKNGSFGLRLRHFSSQGTTKLMHGDLVDSPYSDNNGEIYGNQIIGRSTLTGNLSYSRNVFRYYGYPDTIPPSDPSVYPPLPSTYILYPPLLGVKQQFQKAKIQLGFKSNDESDKLNYKGIGWYHFFDSKTGQKEKALGFSANFAYQFEKFKGFLETSYEHYTTKGLLDTTVISPIEDKTVGWFSITPSIQLSGEKWIFNGGFSFYSAGSSIVGEDDIKLYPKIDFNFIPVKDILTLYAGVNGYLKNSNYSTISYENYWVNPVHNILNEDHQYILSAGAKGKINSEFSYKVEVSYEGIKDMHFYVLKNLNPAPPLIFNNSFDLIYDNAGLACIAAELNYIQEKDYYFSFKTKYYNYTLDHLSFAPQMPNFEIEASAGYKINDKVTGFSDLKITGDRYGLIQEPGQDFKYNLKPIYSLNTGADYQLKPKFKIFGRIDNLLNQHYEQLPGYTSQGLRLIAGITYSF
jgi:hypothetical protein